LAYGSAEGHKAPIDPQAFTIIGGRLYLNYNQEVWELFKKDPAGYIRKAEANWPAVQ
jgi:YHS domain-containing protein